MLQHWIYLQRTPIFELPFPQQAIRYWDPGEIFGVDDKIVYFIPGKSEPTVMYHIDPKRSPQHRGWI